MNQKNIQVFVATHKPIECALPDYCYKTQVNCAFQKELWPGYLHDNSGDNISHKNYCYSELTVLYWAWKNSSADIKGLCHYRRFFTRYTDDILIPFFKLRQDSLLNDCLDEHTVTAVFDSDCDIILTKPYGPYPLSALEELEKYVYPKDITALEQVIEKDFPEYSDSFHKTMNTRNLSYYNMLIAPRELFDNYCQWLFCVLERVEKNVDISQYDRQHQRLFGYLSEVLLNVYIRQNQLKCCYYKTGFLEYDPSPISRLKICFLRACHRLHEFMYRHDCYSVICLFYRLFRRSAFRRYKNYNSQRKL